MRKKLFLSYVISYLIFGTLAVLCSSPLIVQAAPAQNCDTEIVTAANQAITQANSSLTDARVKYQSYFESGFSTTVEETNRREQLALTAIRDARNRITLAASAVREVAVNDCGPNEYDPKRLTVLDLKDQFNDLRASTPTSHRGTIVELNISLPPYSALVGNSSEAECLELIEKARQQHSTILAAIQNLDARASDNLNASSRKAAISEDQVVKSAARILDGYVQQMKSKNCDPAIIKEAEDLQKDVSDKAREIEEKYNATSGSLLGLASTVTDNIAAVFASCDKCEDAGKDLNILIKSIFNALCCLLSEFVTKFQEAVLDIANKAGDYLQHNT